MQFLKRGQTGGMVLLRPAPVSYFAPGERGGECCCIGAGTALELHVVFAGVVMCQTPHQWPSAQSRPPSCRSALVSSTGVKLILPGGSPLPQAAPLSCEEPRWGNATLPPEPEGTSQPFLGLQQKTPTGPPKLVSDFTGVRRAKYSVRQE